MNQSIFLFLVVVNLFTFILMRIDKGKAIKEQYRIPERTFFLLSILGGALGTYLGMKLFRHKTKHAKFIIGIPILIIWNLIAFIYFVAS